MNPYGPSYDNPYIPASPYHQAQPAQGQQQASSSFQQPFSSFSSNSSAHPASFKYHQPPPPPPLQQQYPSSLGYSAFNSPQHSFANPISGAPLPQYPYPYSLQPPSSASSLGVFSPAPSPQLPDYRSESSSSRPRSALSPSPFTPQQLADQNTFRASTTNNMSSDPYAVYTEGTRYLSTMKVDWLKAAIRRINQHCGTYMKQTGKKADLHDSLRTQLGNFYHDVNKHHLNVAHRILKDLSTTYNINAPWQLDYVAPPAAAPAYNPTPNYGAGGAYNANAYASTSNGYGSTANAAAQAAAAAAARAGSAALPVPRFGGYNAAVGAAAGGSWQSQRIEEHPIKFRPSPFYTVDKSLTSVVTMAKAPQGDKKNVTCTFALTEAQKTLLIDAAKSPSNTQYQVRLYCTSDTNWNPSRSSSNQFPAPIEFPASAEVKLNGAVVPANVKGIKKQPGTAPPVNLSAKKGPSVNLASGAINRVDVAYITTDKLFYLVAYLVQYHPVADVVAKIKKRTPKSKEDVIKEIIALNSDDEVESTSVPMALSDPLLGLRIEIPIRSVACKHVLCFDAMAWLEMNEQTPQFICPHCSKALKIEDLVVDGYFEDILAICPDSVDEVSVEPDGTWRSDDDKCGTAKPRNPPPSASTSTGGNTPFEDVKGKGRETPASFGGSRAGSVAVNGKSGNGIGGGGHVLTLDSDDSDDEPLAKRARTGASTSAAASPIAASGGVLDLTLSSDDEDDTPNPGPAPRAAPAPPPPAPAPAAVPRPALAQARVGSSDQVKTAEQAQRDIDAMQIRMVQQYGPDWRQQFGYDT